MTWLKIESNSAGPAPFCEHPARDEINKAIVLKTGSNRDIAYRFRSRGLLHPDAIGRHAKAHIPEELAREIIVQAKRERTAEIDAEINQDQVDISTGLQRIVREIDGILQRAKDAGDDGLALTALRDMRQTLMDLAKLYKVDWALAHPRVAADERQRVEAPASTRTYHEAGF